MLKVVRTKEGTCLSRSQVKSRMVSSSILIHASHLLSCGFNCPVRYPDHVNQNLGTRKTDIEKKTQRREGQIKKNTQNENLHQILNSEFPAEHVVSVPVFGPTTVKQNSYKWVYPLQIKPTKKKPYLSDTDAINAEEATVAEHEPNEETPFLAIFR